MRPRADLDGGKHSRHLLDRCGMAVQGGDPSGKRWRGDNEIRGATAGKGERLLLWSQGDCAYIGIESLNLVERWRITIGSWHNQEGGSGISLVLVDQHAIRLPYQLEERVGQRPLRYDDAH